MPGRVPEVVSWGISYITICVPDNYTNAEAEEFANRNHPSGTESGWKAPNDCDRNKCMERSGCIHMRLVC